MTTPIKITFHNITDSPAIRHEIEKRARRLNHFYNNITSLRAVVEAPHKHHHKGTLYKIIVQLNVPGESLLVTRHPSQDQSHEDIYVAIRDAFHAARRQLQDYSRRHRGD